MPTTQSIRESNAVGSVFNDLVKNRKELKNIPEGIRRANPGFVSSLLQTGTVLDGDNAFMHETIVGQATYATQEYLAFTHLNGHEKMEKAVGLYTFKPKHMPMVQQTILAIGDNEFDSPVVSGIFRQAAPVAVLYLWAKEGDPQILGGAVAKGAKVTAVHATLLTQTFILSSQLTFSGPIMHINPRVSARAEGDDYTFVKFVAEKETQAEFEPIPQLAMELPELIELLGRPSEVSEFGDAHTIYDFQEAGVYAIDEKETIAAIMDPNFASNFINDDEEDAEEQDPEDNENEIEDDEEEDEEESNSEVDEESLEQEKDTELDESDQVEENSEEEEEEEEVADEPTEDDEDEEHQPTE